MELHLPFELASDNKKRIIETLFIGKQKKRGIVYSDLKWERNKCLTFCKPFNSIIYNTIHRSYELLRRSLFIIVFFIMNESHSVSIIQLERDRIEEAACIVVNYSCYRLTIECLLTFI